MTATEEIEAALAEAFPRCIECGGDADDECGDGPICAACFEEREEAERERTWEPDPPFDTIEEQRGER